MYHPHLLVSLFVVQSGPLLIILSRMFRSPEVPWSAFDEVGEVEAMVVVGDLVEPSTLVTSSLPSKVSMISTLRLKSKSEGWGVEDGGCPGSGKLAPN